MRCYALEAIAALANLVAFSLCAWIAFARNVNALFYHFDGSYMLVDVRNQLTSGHPIFEFSNDFLQSIGNIEFPQNAGLLFFFWPINWFSNLQTGKTATYVIIAAIVFASAYLLARLLSQSHAVGLIAGWMLGFLTTPFIPRPFFYGILSVAPDYVLIIAAPVILCLLIRAAGRWNALFDFLTLLGLVAAAFYVLAASPMTALPIIPAAAAYTALALVLARDRSELWRKSIVLTAALCVVTALRWPWYLLGLFSDAAPYLFPEDYTPVYAQTWFASILFQGWKFGWAGPAFVALAAVGAALSIRSAAKESRAAAWTLLTLLLAFVGAGFALTFTSNWIWVPPIYAEMGIWTLYAVFAALALHRFAEFVVRRFRQTETSGKRLTASSFAVILPIGAIVGLLAVDRPPTDSGYPFPPRETTVVHILRTNIALDTHASFNGRLATVAPIEANSKDAWLQQWIAATNWAEAVGNDEMSVDLWYYRIPTLFEYNQFGSPAFHELIRRALQRPALSHQRNITVLTYPDVRVLKLLGVRYVLMAQPKEPIGEVRATEDRGGQPWNLFELSQTNLATYSPTAIETRHDLRSTLDFVIDDKIDLSKRAVVTEEITGDLTPLRSSALSMVDEGLHITAESAGRSLVVVPLEFSHCLILKEKRPRAGATLMRVDGLLSGIVFEHELDATLSFRFGPLINPLCRWRDYQEMKSML